jgi:two-component sensor histidine kinase
MIFLRSKFGFEKQRDYTETSTASEARSGAGTTLINTLLQQGGQDNSRKANRFNGFS